MFRLIISAVLVAGMATAAFAQYAPTTDQPTSTAPPTSKHASPIKPGDRQCIRDTGSLIPAKKGECLPVAGRSYSKGDIDATGETRLGPALEKLDPAVTIQGNGGH